VEPIQLREVQNLPSYRRSIGKWSFDMARRKDCQWIDKIRGNPGLHRKSQNAGGTMKDRGSGKPCNPMACLDEKHFFKRNRAIDRR
jgi:hypothetical protein